MTRRKSDLPPICERWREEARARKDRDVQAMTKMGDGPVGIDFQWPPGWDETGKLRTIKDGPHKGRIMWTSRHEAREIAKMKADIAQREVRYDP